MRMRCSYCIDNTRQFVWRVVHNYPYRVIDNQFREPPFNDIVGEVWDGVPDLVWTIKSDIRRQLEARQ